MSGIHMAKTPRIPARSTAKAMKTLVDSAREGRLALPMKTVAAEEGMDPDELLRRIAAGSVVIMQRKNRCTGIGTGLRTKINVNLGTSSGKVSLSDELKKAEIAEKFGADTISDLSMGGDIDAIRRDILAFTTLPVTTVPIYHAVVECGLETMTAESCLPTLKHQAGPGNDSVCLTRATQNTLAAAAHA
ncbi:phosphomethylpyrimidine synthase ThiC [Methanoregula sp.]|uniref:phosphomethylpyrimidine synthase ThiC n=1 Tax=Methanoregula sp. TaxID=2052170 RepID=UPI0025EBD6CF|nr:phosphomethylpyrimidine synthase ThiC [Methanoregula sp.]